MKAGFYLGNHTYEVKEIKDRKPVDHEVKIEVAWCGLCGTDIHKFEGKNGASVVVPPIILGHECSGIVTEVGENCENFKPGDRVACDPSWGCGRCEWCKKGYQNFCIHRHGVAKGFAEYVYPPEENVYKIDHSLDLEDAAFTEPLSCVLHGMDLLNIESGSNIVMYGMGSIGSLMLQLLKLTAPKNLIVVEREENKQELAIELGATKACTDVIECIGLKNTMEQAIHIAGKRAKVLLFGLGDPEENVSFNQFEAYTKELSIYTSYLNPHTSRKAISLLESGVIDTKKIISARLSLEEMGEELKTKKYSRKGKVMVSLSGKH